MLVRFRRRPSPTCHQAEDPKQKQRANRDRGGQRPSRSPFVHEHRGSIHEATWRALVCVQQDLAMDDGVDKISRPVNGSCYTIQDRRRIHISSSSRSQPVVIAVSVNKCSVPVTEQCLYPKDNITLSPCSTSAV